MNAENVQDREKRRQAFYVDCICTAKGLLNALKEEAGILRRFAGGELVGLLSKKELLIYELSQKLSLLEEFRGEKSPEAQLDRTRLREALREAGELNTSNRLFISRTLLYWQDFLSVLFPHNYGPTPESARQFSAGTKGLAFSREV